MWDNLFIYNVAERKYIQSDSWYRSPQDSILGSLKTPENLLQLCFSSKGQNKTLAYIL